MIAAGMGNWREGRTPPPPTPQGMAWVSSFQAAGSCHFPRQLPPNCLFPNCPAGRSRGGGAQPWCCRRRAPPEGCHMTDKCLQFGTRAPMCRCQGESLCCTTPPDLMFCCYQHNLYSRQGEQASRKELGSSNFSGLLCLGSPSNPSPVFSGTFCTRLAPRTTQYHCGQNFPSNHRIQDYIIPCMAAEPVT